MAVRFSIGDPHRTAWRLGNKEVGDVLGTAAGTVKAYVQSSVSKLSAKDPRPDTHNRIAAGDYSFALAGSGGRNSEW